MFSLYEYIYKNHIHENADINEVVHVKENITKGTRTNENDSQIIIYDAYGTR